MSVEALDGNQGILVGTRTGRAEAWHAAEARARLVQLRSICKTGQRVLTWIEETGGIVGDPSGSPSDARRFAESADVLDHASGFIELLVADEIRDEFRSYFDATSGGRERRNEWFGRLCEVTEGGGIQAGIAPEELDPSQPIRDEPGGPDTHR